MATQGDGAALESEFLDDHRHLTRGLAAVSRALEADDLEEAIRAARALDVEAGPHIEFEESCLYPELEAVLGRPFVACLYAEHRDGRLAIARLSALEPGETLAPEDRAVLRRWLAVAKKHVLSCGSLTSHLAHLPAADRARLLGRLVALRCEGRRWTELPARAPGVLGRSA